MAVLLENQLPGVQYNGLRTNKPAVFGAPVSFMAGTAASVTALGTAASQTVPNATAANFSLVPVQNMTLVPATVIAGQTITLFVTTSGTTSYNLTFGTNFKSQGVLATGTVSGKVFTVEFKSDGTNYNEIARTTAM